MTEQETVSKDNEADSCEHKDPEKAQQLFDFYSSTFQSIPNLEGIVLRETTRNGMSFQLTARKNREGRITRIDIKGAEPHLPRNAEYWLTLKEAGYFDERTREEGFGEDAITVFENQLEVLLLPMREKLFE